MPAVSCRPSVSGRLSPPAGGFPRLGTAVKAGDVLAYVTPPFQAIDVSDMRQKAGELDQQIAIVEKRIARYELLAKTGAVAKVTLDEAILELGPSGAARRPRQDTRRARAADCARLGHHRRGQCCRRADRGNQCGRLPDRRSRAAVGRGPDLQPSPRCADLPRRAPGKGATLTLAFQGAGLTDRSQAIPVHFAIEGETKRLRVGQLVTVLAPTGEETARSCRPAHQRPARRQRPDRSSSSTPRPSASSRASCRVEPLDAERVLVLDGLAAGQARGRAGRRTPQPDPIGARPCSPSSSRKRSRTGSWCWSRPAVLVVFGAADGLAAARRRVPRPQPADRHHHDRGRGPGAAGGRAARHLSDRDPDERPARRHAACARSRASGCRSSTSSSPGARKSSAIASRSPSGSRWCRASSRQHRPADGSDQFDHGRRSCSIAHDRARGRLADERARGRRFRRAPAAAHHSRRGPGHPDGWRGAPVPRRAQPGRAARASASPTSNSRRRSPSSAAIPAAASPTSTRRST